MNIKVNEKEYKIVSDENKTISDLNLEDIITDYYDKFDYIVGDWAYGKVRLKGFYKSNNKLVKSYNDYRNVHEYIDNYCAYGCKYFILEDITKTIEK